MYIDKACPFNVFSLKTTLFISVKYIWFLYIERHLQNLFIFFIF